MGLRGRQTAVMAGVMVQRAQLLVLIERVIQFVGRRHRADPQQHGRQQPGDESRFPLGFHEGQFAIAAEERQAARRSYFSSSNTAVSSQWLNL